MFKYILILAKFTGVSLLVGTLILLAYSFIPTQIFNTKLFSSIGNYQDDKRYFAQEIVTYYSNYSEITGVNVLSIEKTDLVPTNRQVCLDNSSWQHEKRIIKDFYIAKVQIYGHFGLPIRLIKLDCSLKEIEILAE